MDWEAETQVLLAAAGIEATPARVNVAVRQWLRQILRHREYLSKVNADPARAEVYRAKRTAYNREYREHGPKRAKRVPRALAQPDAGTKKAERREEIRERAAKLSQEPGRKREGILILRRL